MYVLTRFMWSLLLENQGINFGNVVSAAQTVTVENDDGITEVDDEKLGERLTVVAENFRCGLSSRFTFFLNLINIRKIGRYGKINEKKIYLKNKSSKN
jgi:hypothetical protein